MAVYSHTKLETFEQCPLKYKLKYIDLIEGKREFIEVFVGRCVHEALKKLYEDLAAGKLNTLDELLAFYHSACKQNWSSRIAIVRQGTTAAQYLDYGEQCIRKYYCANHPFDQSETLHLEHPVEFNLSPNAGYRLRGQVDRIALRADGTFEIHDYKTGPHAPSQQQADNDRQLSFYQLGFLAERPEARRIELIWHYLGPGITLLSKREPPQLLRIEKDTRALIARIERRAKFRGRKSVLCDWCEYRPDCPAWAPRAGRRGRRPVRRSFWYQLGRLLWKLLR